MHFSITEAVNSVFSGNWQNFMMIVWLSL